MVQLQGGAYQTDLSLTKYVQKITEKISHHLPCCNSLQSTTIIHNLTPNIWRTPNDTLAIHLGTLFLLESESELAALLARQIILSKKINSFPFINNPEIETDVAFTNPIFSTCVDLTNEILNQYYPQQDLFQADLQVATVLEKSRYDPSAIWKIQKRFYLLEKENLLPSYEGFWARLLLEEHFLEKLQLQIPEKNTQQRIDEYNTATRQIIKQQLNFAQEQDALLSLQQGDPFTAGIFASEALKQSPHESKLHYILGTSYLHMGRYQEALLSLNTAIELHHSYFASHLQKGIVLAGLGQRDLAKHSFYQSLELLSSAEAHYHLADLLLEEGKQSQAIEHFTIASGLQSPIGKLAQQELVRLDIPDHPAKYLKLQASLDKNGFLSLAIVNPYPIAVRDVYVSVDVKDAPNVAIPKSLLLFSEPTYIDNP